MAKNSRRQEGGGASDHTNASQCQFDVRCGDWLKDNCKYWSRPSVLMILRTTPSSDEESLWLTVSMG